MEKLARPSTSAADAEPQPGIDGPEAWTELNKELQEGFTSNDRRDMRRMGKKQQFRVCAFIR